VLLLSGCSITNTVDNEQRKEYELSDNLIVINEKNSLNSEEHQIKDMELMLENEHLKLYFGKNYDIAVYNKNTGKVYWSNPVFHQYSEEERNGFIDESKRNLFSQVGVEYYNQSQKKLSMTSYPDSFSKDKNQVTYEVEDNTLKVRYGIGTNLDDTGLIQAFTMETFTHYDSILQEMVKKKELSVIEYRNFFNSYTALYYSKLSSQEKKDYSAVYPNFEELGTIYIIKPNLSNKITNQLLEIYSLLTITDEVKQSEEDKMGLAGGGNVPAYFVIPVQYKLHGNDLLVSVDTNSIETAEGYYLTKVELLKSFGASEYEEDGYLFVPDGSGSIITNNRNNTSMDKITIPFYGQDYGKNYSSLQDMGIDSTFPVFGIKADDSAFFAIVENGAAIGGMSAQITSNYMKYNIAYPYFDYTTVDTLGREGVAYAFYETSPDTLYSVRYHFLSGEDATYSGMARYYRTYLMQRGYLKKQEMVEELPLDIGLLGSITKTVNRFGIPVETEYPLTAFSEADSIMKEFYKNGLYNTDVLYTGMLNGGYNFKAVNKVKVQKELGGLKEYKDLVSSLGKAGYDLYTDVDFTRIYEKGYGVKGKEDVSKYLNRNTAYMSRLNLADGFKSYRSASFLVNPLLYGELGASFQKEYEKLNNKKLYLSSIGTYLNGNYSTQKGVTRETSQILSTDLLDGLFLQGYDMKFDSGNDYVLPYAKSLTNIPTTSSHQRIESYSVPFVGMVLKGFLPYTSRSINQSSNIEKALLQTIESGAGLNYLLMYEEQLSLVDTDQVNLFSVNYKIWLEEIIKTYQKLNEELAFLTNVSIKEHINLQDNVNVVVYENGVKIYVNYNKTAYMSEDGEVKALSYLVVP
jgi:hypothetical protein